MELLVGKMVRLEKIMLPKVEEPGHAKNYQVISGRAQLVGFFFNIGRVRVNKKSWMGGRFGSGRRVEFLIRYFRVPNLLSGLS